MTTSSVPGRRPRRTVGPPSGDRPVQRDLSWLPLAIATFGLLLAAYLLVVIGTPSTPAPAGDNSCYDRVVHHAARLADC